MKERGIRKGERVNEVSLRWQRRVVSPAKCVDSRIFVWRSTAGVRARTAVVAGRSYVDRNATASCWQASARRALAASCLSSSNLA